MRNLKPASMAIIIGFLLSVIMAVAKAFGLDAMDGIAWLIVFLPLMLIVSSALMYAAIYFARIRYKNRKYKRLHQMSSVRLDDARGK